MSTEMSNNLAWMLVGFEVAIFFVAIYLLIESIREARRFKLEKSEAVEAGEKAVDAAREAAAASRALLEYIRSRGTRNDGEAK